MPDPILIEEVDVDFNDPQIRGAANSIWVAGEDADRAAVLDMIQSGLGMTTALDVMAETILIRSQQIAVRHDENHPNPAHIRHHD